MISSSRIFFFVLKKQQCTANRFWVLKQLRFYVDVRRSLFFSLSDALLDMCTYDWTYTIERYHACARMHVCITLYTILQHSWTALYRISSERYPQVMLLRSYVLIVRVSMIIMDAMRPLRQTETVVPGREVIRGNLGCCGTLCSADQHTHIMMHLFQA